MKLRAPRARALGAALDRYRLATSAPRAARGFHSRWRTVRGFAIHGRRSLAAHNGALISPTMDPSARTAPRQIRRWLWDTALEDPPQLPILARSAGS